MEIEDRGCFFFFSIITTMNVSDIICHEYSGRTNVETKKMSIFIKEATNLYDWTINDVKLYW